MFSFNPLTYGNSDNVSGHPLDRVCREIEQLVKQWPDRLTVGSTGGPSTVTRRPTARAGSPTPRNSKPRARWPSSIRLSCPQGGDGTEGDIVSQNAALTAKIIDWIMEAGDAGRAELFKLTAAVTSIVPILRAIKSVLDKYPNKKAGITLANSFPTLAFRPCHEAALGRGRDRRHERRRRHPDLVPDTGNAVPEGIEISGNGGPMTYKAAMNFLALGVKTVQFCTIAMKYGLGIVNELESGTAFLMQERGIKSMKELIGIAQPNPVTDFMALSPTKKISDFNYDLASRAGTARAVRTWPSHWTKSSARTRTPSNASAVPSARRSASPAPSRCARARPKNWLCWRRIELSKDRLRIENPWIGFETMTTRFENGIVVTLGKNNQVIGMRRSSPRREDRRRSARG